VLVALLGALSVASADAQTSVLGIGCTTQSDGTRACIGNGSSERVPSFDGVPLDVNVWLPPASQHGPFPVIFYLHGFGGDKNSSGVDTTLARQGYVLVAYSARGFGMSCGLPVSRNVPACARGYEHLADIRYEPRDTQYLAGLLADTGLVNGQRVGVSGTSYGAGQSLMLSWIWQELTELLTPQRAHIQEAQRSNVVNNAADRQLARLQQVGLIGPQMLQTQLIR